MSWFMGGACLFFGLVACGLQPPITPQSKTHCLPLSHTPQQPNSILSLAFPATAKKEGVGGAVEERESRWRWLVFFVGLLPCGCAAHNQPKKKDNLTALFLLQLHSNQRLGCAAPLHCSFHSQYGRGRRALQFEFFFNFSSHSQREEK